MTGNSQALTEKNDQLITKNEELTVENQDLGQRLTKNTETNTSIQI